MREESKQNTLKCLLNNVTTLANTRPAPRPYPGPPTTNTGPRNGKRP